MRFIRSAAALTLAGAATLAASAVPAAPAFAQGPTVIATPSTVAPGASVTFTIICDTTTATSATLLGTTLGLAAQYPMNPTSQSGEFVVTVNLPKTIAPGTYTPPLECGDDTMRTASLTVVATSPTSIPTIPPVRVIPPAAAPGSPVTIIVICSPGSVSATLDGSTLGLPEQIPMTGSMPGANQFATTVDLPTSIVPGQYSLSVECNPNGLSAPVNITVNPLGTPVTGDGATSSALGGPFTRAGLALLAAGGLAVGAGVIWKRRRPGAGS